MGIGPAIDQIFSTFSFYVTNRTENRRGVMMIKPTSGIMNPFLPNSSWIIVELRQTVEMGFWPLSLCGQSLVSRDHDVFQRVGFGPVGIRIHGQTHHGNAPCCDIRRDGGELSSVEETDDTEISFEEGSFHCVSDLGDSFVFEELENGLVYGSLLLQ